MGNLDRINIYDTNAFKVWNFHLTDNPEKLIIESVAILLGDYEIERKYAATLILKILLRDDFRKTLLEDEDLYPYDRNDYRVREWTEKVLSRGECELCGSRKDLEAHHIVKWADYPKGRIDINNGLCLCMDCHIKEHKQDQSYHLMKGKRKYKRGEIGERSN